MQFLVIGLDGTDNDAINRRLAARPRHIELGNELMKKGNFWFGAALTDEQGKMIGSVLIMNYANREELQAWLDIEPYMTEGVWVSTDIKICNVRDPWEFSQTREFYEKHSYKQKRKS